MAVRTQLQAGGRIPVSETGVRLQVTISFASRMADSAAFGLERGLLTDDRYMVFYNQPRSPEGAVQFELAGSVHRYTLELAKIPAVLDRITFAITDDAPIAGLGGVQVDLDLDGVQWVRHDVPMAQLATERALMLVEVYRFGSGWRVRAISAGYAGGLRQLVESFGGVVADSASPRAANDVTMPSVTVPSVTTSSIPAPSLPVLSSPAPSVSTSPVPNPPPAGAGLLARLGQHLRTWQNTRQQMQAIRLELRRLVEQGQVNTTHLNQLLAMIDATGLRADAKQRFKVTLLRELAQRMLDDQRVSDSEMGVLKHVSNAFETSLSELGGLQDRLYRARQLSLMELGQFTPIAAAAVILRQGERAFWQANATALEEKVLQRQYVGGSQGVSIRVMKGVTYRVGSTRGHTVEKTGIVEVGRGTLTVTDQRFVFVSPQRTVELSYSKVVGLQGFRDGLSVNTSSQAKPLTFRMRSEDVEAVLLVVTYHASN